LTCLVHGSSVASLEINLLETGVRPVPIVRTALYSMLAGARCTIAAEPITASGILTPLEEINIGSELRGLILWMAEEGDTVAKDAPLVKLRDTIERFELNLRKAQLDSARCQVERCQLDSEAARSFTTRKLSPPRSCAPNGSTTRKPSARWRRRRPS
jgi:multidrug efflux pump subunit AcrA (membrane-fusion protein)